jgi:putative flavoprotein involved in K+ transport
MRARVVSEGSVVHRRGVTDVPGLCFVGLPWQHTRGSALLGFVQHDAEWVAAAVGRARSLTTAMSG